MATAANDNSPIFSSLGDDPYLGELVMSFVDELPDRVAALQNAFASGDWERLERLAHQMKGAGGSYGFDPLTLPAASVEQAAREAKPQEETALALEKLMAICQRILAGSPKDEMDII